MRRYFLGLVLLLEMLPVLALAAPMAAQPAMDGIFSAFKNHPLVGIAEHHRVAQELDFYATLIRDPRFADEVGNVVVEFGGAARQDTINRYVNGEDVPYSELRKVWTDTVGWIPAVPAIGYMNFFAQVREVNRGLPPQRRIHLWLGEPPIDWSVIKTTADWRSLDRQRDTYPAALIEREILAHGKKALIIYGGGHFESPVPGSAGEKLQRAGWRNITLADIIRHDYPDALFVAMPYWGTANKACARDVETEMTSWPVPALAAPLRGSDAAGKLRGCSTLKLQDANFPPGLTDTEKQQAFSHIVDLASQVDALLYLGPSETLTYSPYIPDSYFDPDYLRTIAQHYLMQTGQVYPPLKIRDYATVPQKVRP